MKKVIFTAIISLLAFSGYSQPASKIDHQFEKDQLIIKARTQKIAAWVCMAGGIVLFTTGASMGVTKATENLFAQSQQDYTGESMLMIAGAAGIIGSIPLFIASRNNKRNARLLVTSQNTSFISPLAVSKKVTGLTLSIVL
jgi:hypothetical protein